MAFLPENVDLTTLGGWFGLVTVVIAWIYRALGVHRTLVSFESQVVTRLDVIERRQAEMGQELRNLQSDLLRHVDKPK